MSYQVFKQCWNKVSICFCLLLCLMGCQSEPPQQNFERKVSVITTPVVERETPIFLETIGTISSPQIVQVKAQVEGKLQSIHVEEGQEVKQGDLLFEIESNCYQASLASAQANLKKNLVTAEFARNKFRRHEALAEKDFVSRLNYDQFASDVELHEAQALIDQAEVALADIHLGYCTIMAPIDGKVSQYNVSVGNLVGPTGSPLIEIRQIAPLYVNFYLSQDEFRQFEQRETDACALTILLPHQESGGHDGRVFFIDNQFDVSSNSILLKGELGNEDRNLWPGQFVKVRLLVRTIPTAKLIPIGAVQLGQNGQYVYVVKPDMSVERRSIQSTGHFEGNVIVDKGLEKDEVVVLDGQISLYDGAKVTIKQREVES